MRTALALRGLYDRYAMVRGPSRSTATRAVKRGFASALAWDEEGIDDPRTTACFGEPDGPGGDVADWVVVQRLVDGECTASSPAERAAAVQGLTGLGYSAGEIAERLRLSERTVVRLRVAQRGRAA